MGLSYESFDERFFDVVDVKQDLVTVCSGFTFIEGPIWNDVTGCLTFNDIPESRTYRLEQGKTVRLCGKIHIRPMEMPMTWMTTSLSASMCEAAYPGPMTRVKTWKYW